MVARPRVRGAVHRFRIELRRDGGPPQTLEFRTARHPSESPEHLAARALAFALEARPGLELRFRPGGVSAGEEPALGARAPDGSRALGVEIGAPGARRLERLLRRFREVAVYCHRDPRPLRRAATRVKGHRERLRIHLLPRELVHRLGEALRADNGWEIEVRDDTVEVAVAPAGADRGPDRLGGRLERLDPASGG